jgi:ParB family chromosome partitioning protein
VAKFGLGKGLDALFAGNDDEQGIGQTGSDGNVDSGQGGAGNGANGGTGEAVLLPLDKLRANPGQPRKYFDEEGMKELAASIKEHGIIQPVIVEEAGGGVYTIIAGERRTRAARLAGLTEAPVIIRTYSEEKRMEVSLIENVQRADLNPIEEAAAYKALMDLTGANQDEIAAKVGKNRSTVANALRLLKLPPRIQAGLEKAEISSGHARALLSIPDATTQERVFNEIVAKGLSVREAEKLAGAGGKSASLEPPKPAKQRDPHLAAMEEKFIETLGTKVAIDGDLAKGSIRIEYYSMQDLDRLYEIVGSR